MVSYHVVTLANSIVGVSVLAMPFCFKYCGVFLATLMLILSAMMTRVVCYFLLKAGVMTKRRSYEMLAYHTFGHGGKFMVEVTIIGFLVGTLIAFLVVIGDLGPQIVAEIFSIENNHSLRTVVMTALALFVALPLGLLRDIDSLGSVSTISFLFYFFLVLKILNEGLGALEPDRVDALTYWRPAGVLQCIPIIAMALSCQTQVFSIYDSLPEPSVQKMNEVVKKAVYLCTVFYFCVGFFGYLGFATEGISGNILMSFGPTWTTQLIKVCFVLSIAFSVPLCVFPCRASLYSLFFRGTHSHHSLHDISTNYIPDGKLRLLTVLVVGSTLIIALLIPNIELVLGLVGSTAGSVICLIFPSAMFIRVTPKKTTERLLAQVLLAAGICIMVLTTYVTLYAVEQSQVKPPLQETKMAESKLKIVEEAILGPEKIPEHEPPVLLPKDEDIVHFEPKKDPLLVKEPPRQLEEVKAEKPGDTNLPAKPNIAPPSVLQKLPPEIPKDELKEEEPIASKRESQKHLALDPVLKVAEPAPLLQQKPQDEGPPPLKPEEDQKDRQNAPVEVVHSDAHDGKLDDHASDKTKEFLDKLGQHQKEQERILAEQHKILDEMAKQHQDEHGHGVEKKEDTDGKIIDKLKKATEAQKKNVQAMGSLVENLNSAKNPAADDVPVPKSADTQPKVIENQNPEAEAVKPNVVEDSKQNVPESEPRHPVAEAKHVEIEKPIAEAEKKVQPVVETEHGPVAVVESAPQRLAPAPVVQSQIPDSKHPVPDPEVKGHLADEKTQEQPKPNNEMR